MEVDPSSYLKHFRLLAALREAIVPVLEVSTSLSHGGNLSRWLSRKEATVGP